MRVVLYAHDMEPITILELSSWAYDFLEQRGSVYLAVHRPIRFTPPSEMIDLEDCHVWQVCITAETFVRNGQRYMFLFTHDEEQALLLKAAFLPGQRSALREHERDAFAKGFLTALSGLRG